MNQPIQTMDEEWSRLYSVDDSFWPEGTKVGVILKRPHPDNLIKLPSRAYRKRFSVPLAKVGKVYRTIRDMLKNCGFIHSKSQKYNFCWGFSKHRDQVKV